MATRPGFIWSGTEWVAIGQEAIVNPFYYQATEPTTPSTGDIWIESDVDVPSVDSAQFLRWRKTMAGGETSLSGNDDSSLPLQYTPGYEQLYINGVLMVRGVDYTATTGTTVTALTALVADDVVEVFSTLARTVADVYTQTQSDAKYALQTNFPAGAWTTFTPSMTNFNIGSTGTVSAAYALVGKTLFVRAAFTLGGTGISIGTASMTLPNSYTAKARSVAPCMIVDQGTAFFSGLTYSNGTSVTIYVGVASGTYTSLSTISSSIPMVWVATDELHINFAIEVD